MKKTENVPGQKLPKLVESEFDSLAGVFFSWCLKGACVLCRTVTGVSLRPGATGAWVWVCLRPPAFRRSRCVCVFAGVVG